MKVNSIGALNSIKSTSFGQKQVSPSFCGKKDDNQSWITVPRAVYMALLAATLGGLLALSSCSTMNEPVMPTTKNTTTYPTTPITPSNPVTPTTGQNTPATASQNLLDLVSALGVNVVKTASNIQASGVIKEGDVIEFSYHDNFAKTDNDLSINPQLSTKDTLVFDGTMTNTGSGQTTYIRYKIATMDDGQSSGAETLVTKLSTKHGRPISENSGWNTDGVFKYVSAPDGIKEYEMFDNGIFVYSGKYVPKDGATVSFIDDNNVSSDLTNVSVSSFHNLDTGIPDIHM